MSIRSGFTTVTDMNDGTHREYGLDADAALIAAHAQYDCGDWSTWDYATRYSPAEIVRHPWGSVYGNQAVLTHPEAFR